MVAPGRTRLRTVLKSSGEPTACPFMAVIDRPRGHAGRGRRAPAVGPVDQGAGADGRDGRGHGQVRIAGVAAGIAPLAVGAAALLLFLLLGLGLRAAARSRADESSTSHPLVHLPAYRARRCYSPKNLVSGRDYRCAVLQVMVLAQRTPGPRQ